MGKRRCAIRWFDGRTGAAGSARGDIATGAGWPAERDGKRLLTFGAGIHHCVGANLARAEIQEGLTFLAENVKAVRPDGGAEFGTPSGIYGLDRLPLVLER